MRPQIAGMLSRWDRILLFGTLPKIWRENAERLAAENWMEIEFLRKRNVRKEDRVKALLAKRGDHPGLVCILSAMEACSTYKPWHNKNTGKTYLLPDDGKCLHYYFYFIDEDLGLGYVRVPTWLPCRLQVYFNGHGWLASVMRKRKIDYQLIDNAFVEIADWERAQQIANGLEIKRLRLQDARRIRPGTGSPGSVTAGGGKARSSASGRAELWQAHRNHARVLGEQAPATY